MNRPALLLSLLALGALGLVACGDDDDQTTAASETETTLPAKPPPAQVQALRRDANTWARLFSRGGVCNKYMGQPICVRLTPVSAAFQKSFADATIEDIKLKAIEQVPPPVDSIYRAAVKFSNGEVIMFSGGVPGPEAPAGSCAGPVEGALGTSRTKIAASSKPPRLRPLKGCGSRQRDF
jgi:hypothetical protein